MKGKKTNVTRKRFLAWGIAIVSFLSIPALFRSGKKETKKVKMLTQDGHLVEIDIENIPADKRKIKPADIHTWVQKKKASS